MTKNAPRPKPQASGQFIKKWGVLIALFFLILGTLAVYWPVTGFEFINFDDPTYVTENTHVKDGLTWSGLKWSICTNEGANWHPVTWVSHMLDCQVYGMKSGGHHATNLLFHLLNSCLLFLLLLRLTGKRGPSFVVAALFAWHPLHVESVAWVAERKDVLSTFFGLLAMFAYVSYAQNSKIKNQKSKIAYGLALLCFTLGLLSKPMLVTLPLVLLLLDYWPLDRMTDNPDRTSWPRLILEKIPFLLLAIASCIVTLWAQRKYGAVVPIVALPAGIRFENAAFAYCKYIGKIFWPTNLAAFYPYSNFTANWLTTLLAAAPIAIFSVIALRLKKLPCIAVGWFWFIGMLVPVIGLVQVGGQAMADRYTYLPAVGLFIAIVFAANDLANRFQPGKVVLAITSIIVLAGCLAVTQRQVLYWHDSEQLFRHAIAVTTNNQAAYNNLGNTLEKQHRYREAADAFKMAVQAWPGYSDGHANLANIYRESNQPLQAIAEYQLAIKLDPKNARAHYFLAGELLKQGDVNGALEHYRTGLALRPDRADFHYQLAVILLARGEIEEAQQHFREALRIAPDWIEALNNLAWSLATLPDARFRNGKEAVELASHTLKIIGTNDANALDTLAAAYAESGRFSEAVTTAQAAEHIAETNHQERLAREIVEHLDSYRKNQPVRELPQLPDASKSAN